MVDPESAYAGAAYLDASAIVKLDLAAEASRIGPPLLRALDAIHLVSALRVRSAAGAFVAYDQRLTRAAEAVGLEVVQPGNEAA